jgi:hypothetical protein
MYTDSSSNSIYSRREGSVISFASTASSSTRTYSPDSCKLWYRRGASLNQLSIIHVEVQHLPRNNGTGTGIRLVVKTSDGQRIVDDLWMTGPATNTSPFFENSEIVSTFKKRDAAINYVVHFSPHASFHPQYSFATKEDAFDFMSTITGKTLLCSIDIDSIKSSMTHGNAFEAGCETLQVWDDPMAAMKTSGGAKTIKFFRNKNASANSRVVEFQVNCLRAPEKERKTGKLVFAFRDMLDGVTRELKYLKIAFGNDPERAEFLKTIGF